MPCLHEDPTVPFSSTTNDEFSNLSPRTPSSADGFEFNKHASSCTPSTSC